MCKIVCQIVQGWLGEPILSEWTSPVSLNVTWSELQQATPGYQWQSLKNAQGTKIVDPLLHWQHPSTIWAIFLLTEAKPFFEMKAERKAMSSQQSQTRKKITIPIQEAICDVVGRSSFVLWWCVARANVHMEAASESRSCGSSATQVREWRDNPN